METAESVCICIIDKAWESNDTRSEGEVCSVTIPTG